MWIVGGRLRGGYHARPRERRDGRSRTDHYQTPTCPRTDSMSFAGSKPTPFLNTVSTRLISPIDAAGLPSSTTRSACLPVAIVPMRASRPRYLAPFDVPIAIASSGVNPASTRSSICRWSAKPGTTPPDPVGSVPAMSRPPAFTNARSSAIALGNSVRYTLAHQLRNQRAERRAVLVDRSDRLLTARLTRTDIGLLVGDEVGGRQKAVLQVVDAEIRGLAIGHRAQMPGDLHPARVSFVDRRL